MTRFIAFLRSINIGGRTVKMDELRRLFEGMGFSGVETFIASGNVAFKSASRSASSLEKKIAANLNKSLGYQVTTFVRSSAELTEIAQLEAFREPPDQARLYVAFVAAPVARVAREKLLSFQTGTDTFRVVGREVYWLCRTRFSDSTFSGPLLERILGVPATVRNSTTVRKLAAKYAG